LLEPAGVTPRLLAAGLRVERMNLRDGAEILTTVDFSKSPGPYNFMLALPQSETEEILQTALEERGIAVERETELTGFSQNSGGVEAALSTGGDASVARADYILGCDGAHSTVRNTLGIGFAGERYPESWSLADIRMDWPLGHGEGNLFMAADGQVLFVISMPGERYRAIANAPDALSLLPAGSRVSEILWQTDFTVNLRQVESYGTGRAYLAGDAAHIHTPAGGRGMNLGIEDVCVFAERLAHGGLETYSRDRHRVGRQVVRDSDQMFRMASLGNPALRAVRNFMLRHIVGKEFVQSRFRRRLAGLDAGGSS
jgi:2-polyprenyl-6-methoxyphenol hydroxylase-like FAD-dependent oxidoreductase